MAADLGSNLRRAKAAVEERMSLHAADFEENVSIAALMWGVLGGPFAWALDEGLSYAIVGHACSTGKFFWLHVIGLFALLVAFSAGWAAWKQVLLLPGPHDEEDDAPRNWTWWTARLGLASSVSFSIVIIAQAIPRFILSPCD